MHETYQTDQHLCFKITENLHQSAAMPTHGQERHCAAI